MNRDNPPYGAGIALATGELLVTGRRAVVGRAVTDPAEASAAVRAAVARFWPKVTPEAARDVMLTCAQVACEAGLTTVPDAVSAAYAGQLDGAEGMLELTGEWITAGKPEPSGGFTPPYAFASSVAFDRDEDEQTLTSLSVLLALAHIPQAGERAGAGPAADDDGEFYAEDACACGVPEEECGCYGEDDDCTECGGSGYCIPNHCCACGGNEYTCTCCPNCGAQYIGTCPCKVTVKTHEGGTLILP